MKTKKRKKRNAHEWIVCMYIYIIYIYTWESKRQCFSVICRITSNDMFS
jgi:hypothetical protein